MKQATENSQGAKKNSVAQFVNDVRSEMRKVTWATRGETISSSIQVFIMVVIAAIFFYVVDVVLKAGIGGLISLASNISR